MASRRFTGAILLVVVCALVLSGLVPRDLQAHPHWNHVGWLPFRPMRLGDLAANLLLFVPVGLTAAVIFNRGVMAATCTAIVLSLTGEWLQIYSHSRFPSITDVVCNVAGAAAAAYAVGRLRRPVQPHH